MIAFEGRGLLSRRNILCLCGIFHSSAISRLDEMVFPTRPAWLLSTRKPPARREVVLHAADLVPWIIGPRATTRSPGEHSLVVDEAVLREGAAYR